MSLIQGATRLFKKCLPFSLIHWTVKNNVNNVFDRSIKITRISTGTQWGDPTINVLQLVPQLRRIRSELRENRVAEKTREVNIQTAPRPHEIFGVFISPVFKERSLRFADQQLSEALASEAKLGGGGAHGLGSGELIYGFVSYGSLVCRAPM